MQSNTFLLSSMFGAVLCSILFCSVLGLAKPRQLIDADVGSIVAGLEICQMVRLMVHFHFLFQVSEIISYNIISAAKLLALTACHTDRDREEHRDRETDRHRVPEREREGECKTDRCRGSHK